MTIAQNRRPRGRPKKRKPPVDCSLIEFEDEEPIEGARRGPFEDVLAPLDYGATRLLIQEACRHLMRGRPATYRAEVGQQIATTVLAAMREARV